MARVTYLELKAWCARVANGGAGVRAYYKKEHGRAPCADEIVAFTIRALANPACEGSHDVLKEIERQRRHR